MNYQNTEVYDYLNYLKTYLLGDLRTFHDVCKKYEDMEDNDQLKELKRQEVGRVSSTNGISTIPSTSGFSGVSGFSGTSGSGPYDLHKIHKYFRCTGPLTLTLFSTIDIIGYLIGNGRPEDTEINFTNFFDCQLRDGEKKVLVHVFRHGMAHGYFPKLNVGISYRSTNPQDQLYFKEHGDLVLNVNTLESLVISRFQKIKNEESLYPKMETQFRKLLDKYEQKCRDDITTLNNLIA